MENFLLLAEHPGERYGTAMFILLKYLKLLFFPHPLVYDYSYNQIPLINITHPKALFSLLIFSALFTYAVIVIKKKNLLAFCILFFLLTISIYSNIFVLIKLAATVAERYLFAPSLAACIAVPFILFKMNSRFKSIFPTSVLNVAYIAVLLAFGARTVIRSENWKDNFTLCTHDIKYAQNSARANANFGQVYFFRKELDKAKPYFKKAIEIDKGMLTAYTNLAYIYYSRAEFEKAESVYAMALENKKEVPASFLFSMGVVKSELKKTDEAIIFFQKALAVNPYYTDALMKL
jgi:tetratricopeptide (TPR) repeat protein